MKQLKELAKKAVLNSTLSSGDPQTSNLWYCGRALNISSPYLKASLWGDSDAITISLNKCDVWDRRVVKEPIVTLEEVKKGAFHPNFDKECKESLGVVAGHMGSDGVRREGYPAWHAIESPIPKPVGQIIIIAKEFSNIKDVKITTYLSNGNVCITLKNGNKLLNLNILPMMDRNLIAIKCSSVNLAEDVNFRLYRHKDTRGKNGSLGYYGFDYAQGNIADEFESPLAFEMGDVVGVYQKLPAEKTFPNGFEYALCAKVNSLKKVVKIENNIKNLGTKATTVKGKGNASYLENALMPKYDSINNSEGSASTVCTDGNFEAFITVPTSNDNQNVIDCAQNLLRNDLDFGKMVESNTQWYNNFYDKRENGRISLGNEFDKEYIKYVFRTWTDSNTRSCKPDPLKYEADSVYAPFECDSGLWHSLNCYNDLYDSPWHLVMHHEDRLQYWVNLVKQWLEAAKSNVHEVFNMSGATISHGYLPPIKADCYHHVHSVFEFCMEIGAQVAKVLWDIWDYTQSEEFLVSDVYPYLSELASFYSQYVTLGEDGKYHVVPTVSAEHWGLRYQFSHNKDSSSALSFIKWTFRKFDEATKVLQRDRDKAEYYLQIEKKMPRFSTCILEGKEVITDVLGVNPKGMQYNHYAGFLPILLTDVINLDSDEKDKQIAVDTFEKVVGWHKAEILYLIGKDNNKTYNEDAWFHRKQVGENITELIENNEYVKLCEIFENEPERLLNSRSGIIHFLPAYKTTKDIYFCNLRARGGFLVSLVAKCGEIQKITIKSLTDKVCKYMNPFNGKVEEKFIKASKDVILQKI